jgi:hypothetical protein
MTTKIDLHEDMDALLASHAARTRLTIGDIINRILSAHTAELHELLALADTYPELSQQSANLLQSFGPEPLMDGIKRIAPPGYLTLAERFERDLCFALEPVQSASQ